MEHPSSYIPAAMWYNYNSYNDLLNRPRQLENLAPPPPAPPPRPIPMVPQPAHSPMHMVPQPAHSPMHMVPQPAHSTMHMVTQPVHSQLHMVPQPSHSPMPDVTLQMAMAAPPAIKKPRKKESWEGKEKNFHCNQCDSRFHTQYKLNVHMRIHTGIRPYVCDVVGCGKSFIQGSNLKAHRRVHTGERPYKCEECGKTFKASSHLVGHKRIHTGEKPYLCGFCNEAFYTSTLLQMHVRKHTGEKPYQCDYCGEAFAQTLALRIHKRIHTGESPYKCYECNAAYISDKELTAHRKRYHKDSKPFRCEICFKKFRRPTFVVKHQAKCMGPNGSFPFSCEKCGKKFRTEIFCAKHQVRCKGPKIKKRIGRPPKHPRAEGEEGGRRRSRGTGIRKRFPKPIAPTDRISRSSTRAIIKEEAEETIKEEPKETTSEREGGIDINGLVEDLGIGGFSKEDLNEVPDEVFQTIPKENITQEFSKDLIIKTEQQKNSEENDLSNQDIKGHEEQQLGIIPDNLHQQIVQTNQEILTPHHQPYLHQPFLDQGLPVHQQTISVHQHALAAHQQEHALATHQQEHALATHTLAAHQQEHTLAAHQQEHTLAAHQEHTLAAHQREHALAAHQQVITSTQQIIPLSHSIPLQQAPLPPILVSDHQSDTPAASLTYEQAQPYVVDLSGNQSNAYYSRQ